MFRQCSIVLLSISLYGTTGQSTSESYETTTVFEVTSEPPNSTVENNSTSPCGVDEWQCNNGLCISGKEKCNGLIDCKDASDEYLDTCSKSPPRPIFALFLQCSAFWTTHNDYLCPEICQTSPEFCYYALLAENREENSTLCILPKFPPNGTYQIIPSQKHGNNDSQSDSSAPKNFWLNYTCVEPYVMVQNSKHWCINGDWENNNDTRYCSEACALNKNDNFTYTCPEGMDHSVQCNKYVAINTNVTVQRSKLSQDQHGKTPNVSVEIPCTNEKVFNISTGCVNEVDRLQQEFESPTMIKLNEYEKEFNNIKSNETGNSNFHNLVVEFNKFAAAVNRNLTIMQEKAEKCDLSLDLLLWDLQIKSQISNSEEKQSA